MHSDHIWIYLSWEEILQCVLCGSLKGENGCLRVCGEKELTKTDLKLTAAFFSWLYPLHAKWTLPQNKFSEVGVKLVAKGSTGSLAAPSSKSCSPLPWCAQAAHSRWHPLHVCSHRWKQMAMGNYSRSQPDVPAVQALHWSSVPSFLFLPFTCIKSVCLCVLEGDFILQNRETTTCAPAIRTIWDIAFPATPSSGPFQNASQRARSQLLDEVCQDGLDQFCDFFPKSL